MTDPIADMLTKIRNAQAKRHPCVLVPYSKLKHNLAKILKKEGFILDVNLEDAAIKKRLIKINLKYSQEGRPVIRNIERTSRPGQKIYSKKDKLPRVLQGMGTSIISTSQGLLTDKEARKRNIGGELICKIY